MFKMRIVSNQKGAGMMMAMAAMAALGGAAFMMGDMFTNAEKVIKKDSRVVAYQLLVDTVRKNLYAGSNCTQSFASNSPLRSSMKLSLVEDTLGKVLPPQNMDVLNLTNALDLETGISPLERGIEVKGLPLTLDSSPIVLEPNWMAKTGTSIKSMRMLINRVAPLPAPFSGDRVIRYPTNPASPTSPTTNLKAADAYLIIEPDHKGINVWSPENKKFWIKLYVYYEEATKQIHSCYDPTSEAVFCTETMKGTYVNDPNIPANARCRPDIGCFTYQSGLIDSSVACPSNAYTNYQTNQITPTMKTCTWCPSSPYDVLNLPTVSTLVGADDDNPDVDDLDLDCSAANPYAGLSAQEAWEEFSEYQALRSELTPEQTAEYAGCINYEVPCYDYPETCANNCGGPSTCNCPTGVPDKPSTTDCNECDGTGTGCGAAAATGTCTDKPATCENECGGPATCSCPTGLKDKLITKCFDECTGEDIPNCDTCNNTCFIAGTQITMSDGSVRTIEDVLLGEKVIDGSYKVQNVDKLHKLPYKGPLYGINGGRHFFTPNHPFMTIDGWKSLDPESSKKEIPGERITMLKVGDILVTKKGYEVIYSMDSIEVDDYVYNLSISSSHEYFADEYLVHNVPVKGKDPNCQLQ